MESCKVAILLEGHSDYGELQSCDTFRGALKLLESCKVAILLEGHSDYGRVAKLRNFHGWTQIMASCKVARGAEITESFTVAKLK